jgi:hypothetical protein
MRQFFFSFTKRVLVVHAVQRQNNMMMPERATGQQSPIRTATKPFVGYGRLDETVLLLHHLVVKDRVLADRLSASLHLARHADALVIPTSTHFSAITPKTILIFRLYFFVHLTRTALIA